MHDSSIMKLRGGYPSNFHNPYSSDMGSSMPAQGLKGNLDSSGGSFSSFLKQFDIYTKIEADYQVHTSSGATISILGWVVIMLLVFSEIGTYMNPQIKEHMIVDTTLGTQLRINLNITFHALTCAETHVDAIDVAGDNQLNIEHDMLKQRISPNGIPVGEPSLELVGSNVKVEMPKDYCGQCYGAEGPDRRCCNTCDDLKKAYAERGWSSVSIMKSAEQCMREKSNPYSAVLPGEGCRISGTMRVSKVAGNWHIAHGESIVRDGKHIHQFIPSEAPGFNVSHTIHSVSFGDPYPAMPANPLDGIAGPVTHEVGTGLFQYFIRIIPTVYSDGYRKIYTNQYTITKAFKPLQLPDIHANPSGGNAQPLSAVLPGIFFVYDLSPFMVEVQCNRAPLSHLFTKLCAIVGGVLSLTGVVDGSLYRLSKLWSGKKI